MLSNFNIFGLQGNIDRYFSFILICQGLHLAAGHQYARKCRFAQSFGGTELLRS